MIKAIQHVLRMMHYFICLCRYLQSNRISTIESGAFQSVTVSSSFDLSQNKLRIIESNAFSSISVWSFSFLNNLLGDIQPYAFNGITGCYSFYMRNMDIGTIMSHSFTDFSCNYVYLESSRISKIEQGAFTNFRATEYL